MHPTAALAVPLAAAFPPPAAFSLRRAATPGDWARVADVRVRTGQPGDEPADHGGAAVTFLLERREAPIATTRTTHAASGEHAALPAHAAFARELAAAFGPHANLVEASRVADLSGSRNTLFHLFKAHMLRCLLVDADGLVMAVREPEIGFHTRMLNMEILSGPEPYPGEERRVLMGLDVRRHAAALSKRLPVLAIAGGDPEAFVATGRVPFPWDPK